MTVSLLEQLESAIAECAADISALHERCVEAAPNYDIGPDDCRRAALSFLSGWTQALQAAKYDSGVYSNIAAAITSLLDDPALRRRLREQEHAVPGDEEGNALKPPSRSTQESLLP